MPWDLWLVPRWVSSCGARAPARRSPSPTAPTCGGPQPPPRPLLKAPEGAGAGTGTSASFRADMAAYIAEAFEAGLLGPWCLSLRGGGVLVPWGPRSLQPVQPRRAPVESRRFPGEMRR